LACHEGLELSLQHSHVPIMVESDCLNLVSAVTVKTRSQDCSPFWNTIKEIQVLASGSRVCKFVKVVNHSQVRISYCLANWARVESQNYDLFRFSPGVILQMLDSCKGVYRAQSTEQ
jgi:hypothetical protein